MIIQAVIRFELQGLSAGLYRMFDDNNAEIGWHVVSTSTGKCIPAISFEHGRYLLDGCINEIWSRVGYEV